MSAEYSEDRLVQQTTANFFEQTLKWHSIYTYKKETFGTNGTLGRKDKREVVLTRYLRQALEKFNPGHPNQLYDDATLAFTTSNISDQLITINQKKYQLIREGILEKPYKNPEGETINPRLKVIDFQNRVYEGKNNGLLIDYNGILTSLRAALARYAHTEVGSTDESITPYNDLNQLREDYAIALQNCIDHIANLGFDLQELVETAGFDKITALASAVNTVCTNDESRARFEVLAREVFKKKQALITEPKLTTPYQGKYNAIEQIYKRLHEQHKISLDIDGINLSPTTNN